MIFLSLFFIGISCCFIGSKQESINETFTDSIKKNDAKMKKNEVVDDFIVKNSFILKDDFSKVALKKDNKVYKFNEISETKQLLLKLFFLKQAKESLISIEKTESKNADLDEFSKSLDKEILKNKYLIYKLYGSSLHLLDRDFLEAIK